MLVELRKNRTQLKHKLSQMGSYFYRFLNYVSRQIAVNPGLKLISLVFFFFKQGRTFLLDRLGTCLGIFSTKI